MTYAFFEKTEKIVIYTHGGVIYHVTADLAHNHIEGLITFELNNRKVAQIGISNLLFWAVVDNKNNND